MVIVHEGKKLVKCGICDYVSSYYGTLKRHVASVHEVKKPFECEMCDYSCSLKGNMRRRVALIDGKNESSKSKIF